MYKHDKLKKIKTLFLLLLPIVILLSGCFPKPVVRVDIDTVLKDNETIAGKTALITADLKDILDRYDLYLDRNVEVTAPVSYFGSAGFWTWYLLLEQDGQTLRCYTHYYRIEPGRDAVTLLSILRSQKGRLTVTGTLRRDGIDLKTMTYNSQTVRTDYRPPSRFYPYFGWPFY